MHHFGAEVRRARESAAMTQSELGDLVPVDKATVSRIEAGLTVPDAHFAEVCAAAFRNDWFTRFWHDSQTWDATFPAQFREFAEYELEATSLWLFEHTLMPGLLQTEEYARAVLERHPHVTADEVAERVAARMARQSVLDRETPPLVYVLLDENVLRREVGNAKIMHDAVSHLAALAARPRLTVQLLPGTGAHAGLQGAMAMAETPDASVVNLEDFTDGRTTDSPALVGQASERFDTLRSDAYRRSESLDMIESAAEQWKP
jgi:transcriptional regulator with XRE-family HTH domain